ncbi:MAG: nuclear transport factor 2 family protein [Novosphingobium sp.]|nr:nuclear transport factor 2 family protein [Novosphingobium sp.]MCP5402286.1 nuclear transport factor 2 family protein [Novosphingobium sp.]
MPTPTEVVLEFCAMWEQPGGPDEAIRRYFTDRSIWENHGMAITTGQDEAIALNAAFGEKFGMGTIWIEQLAVAETGNKVLTERIDHLRDRDGNSIGSFPVMGVFEVEGDKILSWRDYFDTAGMLDPGA